MRKNPLFCTDFYKTTHHQQYPAGTSRICSNLTPRSDRLKNIPDDLWTGKVTWFGLQYFLKEFLQETWQTGFFDLPKDEVIAEYSRRMDASLGEGVVGTKHIEKLHDLGYLPICIRALPEGTQVPIRVPVLTIENTHDDFAWLTNYFETALSTYVWKMTTAATMAHHYRLLFQRYADETCDNDLHVAWQGHDFACRGLSGMEDAAAVGAAHLTAFSGTDTIPAISFVEEYYGWDETQGRLGSIPASEHAVSCSNILHIASERGVSLLEAEEIFIRRMLTEVYPSGIVSLVSDSFSFWDVVETCLPNLKDIILGRDGVCSIRPDSGTPEDILCGKEFPLYADIDTAIFEARRTHASLIAEGPSINIRELPTTKSFAFGPVRVGDDLFVIDIDCKIGYKKIALGPNCDLETIGVARKYEATTEEMGLVESLAKTFGSTTNSKGYKVLNPKISCVYGDSITPERAQTILRRLKEKGFASSNVYLGIGSFTYNFCTRDTFGFAVKATHCEINGEPLAIYKDPKTDSGTKKSARGRVKVVKGDDGELKLVDGLTSLADDYLNDEMRTAFLNGFILYDDDLNTIRERSRA